MAGESEYMNLDIDEVEIPTERDRRGTIDVGAYTYNVEGDICNAELYASLDITDLQTGEKRQSQMIYTDLTENDFHRLETIKKLRHPSMVNVLGFDLNAEYEDTQCIAILQESTYSCPLFDFLLHSPKGLPEPLVKYIMECLFSAVKALHSSDLFHGEINPERIRIGNNYHIKLADCGIAQLMDQNSPYHPAFQPEEEPGKESDVFSLGVLLFFLLVGFPPFRETNNDDPWFKAVSEGHWEEFWDSHGRRTSIPARLRPLIEMMICPPDRRAKIEGCSTQLWMMNALSFEEFHDDFETFLCGPIRQMSSRGQTLHSRRCICCGPGGVTSQIRKACNEELKSTTFVPARVLCESHMRRAIEAIEVGNSFHEHLARTITDFISINTDISSKASHEHSQDLIRFWSTNLCGAKEARDLLLMATSKEELECLTKRRNEFRKVFDVLADVFGDPVSKAIRSYLYTGRPFPEFINFENLWEILNYNIMEDVHPVLQKDLNLYQELDDAELCVFNKDVMCFSPAVFHVKFGFGTLVHLCRIAFRKGACEGIDVRFDSGECLLMFDVQRTRHAPFFGEVECEGELEILVKMYKLPNQMKGRALAFTLHGDAFWADVFFEGKERFMRAFNPFWSAFLL